MKQTVYGLLLFVFLALPPVARLLESIMLIHMHMQMPLLVAAGFLMARFLQIQFPVLFEKWNANGVPGILLFAVNWTYWMIPRAMDEALTVPGVELFKFISLPFLAGIPLRDSWPKLAKRGNTVFYLYLIVTFLFMSWVYIAAHDPLCNNYSVVEQKTLGWGSLTFAVCLILYVVQLFFTDQSEYEEFR